MSDILRSEARSGVPRPTIHRILSGERRNPKARTLDRLARTLGTSHDELIQGEFRRHGLPVADEMPTYDAEVQRLAAAIQSVPGTGRTFRRLLMRLLNAPPGTGR